MILPLEKIRRGRRGLPLTSGQYSQETATTLAQQLLEGATAETTIAVISAPSAFVQLKNLLVCRLLPVLHQERPAKREQASKALPEVERPKIYLLEFDQRFGVFPEFVFYDFQQPFKLPGVLPRHKSRDEDSGLTCFQGNMKGTVDRFICDPPFLNEDCQTKGESLSWARRYDSALNVQWLTNASRHDRSLVIQDLGSF